MTHFEKIQLYFDDFNEAIEVYREKYKLLGNDVVFIVSYHPYTYGYWIETKSEGALSELDTVYVGDEVFALTSFS